MIAPVGESISGMPGPPCGPSKRMTTTSPFLIFCCCIAWSMSSSESKQLAVPVNLQAFLAGDLGHRAVGAEVAAHDADVTGRLERVRERADDVLARR